MQFTARHTDGFTARVLAYTVSYSEGVAELEASWFRPEPPTEGHRVRFALDSEPLVRLLPALRVMGLKYEASWEDCDHKYLVVELAGETLRWTVYGGQVLKPKHPKLHPWFELWEWLEGQVAPHLPS